MLREKILVFIAALFIGSASARDHVDIIKTKRLGRNKRALKNKNAAVEREDVAFWTRLLQEGNVGSLPVGSSPPVSSVSLDHDVIPLNDMNASHAHSSLITNHDELKIPYHFVFDRRVAGKRWALFIDASCHSFHLALTPLTHL